MKKHLYFYGFLILAFIAYNFLFRVQDERTDTAINILFASIIFGYIGYMAFVLIKKMGKKD